MRNTVEQLEAACEILVAERDAARAETKRMVAKALAWRACADQLAASLAAGDGWGEPARADALAEYERLKEA